MIRSFEEHGTGQVQGGDWWREGEIGRWKAGEEKIGRDGVAGIRGGQRNGRLGLLEEGIDLDVERRMSGER